MIRPIQLKDNPETAAMIRSVLIEMQVPKVGTAYADKALDCLYETYNIPHAEYFIIEKNNKIVGGAGISQLANYDGPVCELQKMYLLTEIRGKGLGAQMMHTCLDFAIINGFKQVYIETMPNMIAAQKLYTKAGFYYIDGPLGNTGHCSCPVHMLKDL